MSRISLSLEVDSKFARFKFENDNGLQMQIRSFKEPYQTKIEFGVKEKNCCCNKKIKCKTAR